MYNGSTFYLLRVCTVVSILSAPCVYTRSTFHLLRVCTVVSILSAPCVYSSQHFICSVCVHQVNILSAPCVYTMSTFYLLRVCTVDSILSAPCVYTRSTFYLLRVCTVVSILSAPCVYTRSTFNLLRVCTVVNVSSAPCVVISGSYRHDKCRFSCPVGVQGNLLPGHRNVQFLVLWPSVVLEHNERIQALPVSVNIAVVIMTRVTTGQLDQVFFCSECCGIYIALLMCDDVCGYQLAVPISLALLWSLMNCAVSLLWSLVVSWTFDNAFPLRSLCMASVCVARLFWFGTITSPPSTPLSTHTHTRVFVVTCFIISEINVKWPSKLMHAANREISFVIGWVLKHELKFILTQCGLVLYYLCNI